MQNFVFENRTKILFGRGMERQVGEEARRFATKILLHHSGGHVVRSGLLDKVKDSLKATGVQWVELGGVQPNPRLSLVYEGIRLCRNEKIGLILAVGGGSVIDSAKAIAAGVPYAGDVWDFYDGKGSPSEALPVATVLTIPAAGSEASPSSVITDERGPWKRGLTAECLRPVFSILNPELTFSLPPYQTACGIVDMLAHIMERYFTREDHVELTDRLCEATMKTIVRNAPVVIHDPTNYHARAEIMWAGTIAHNDLLGTGRVGDWATHMIEHEISALYDIAHGAGLAIVFPAWMEYNLQVDVRRFARFAEEVFGVDGLFYDPEQTARQGILRLKEFYRSIGLAPSLREADIPTDKIPEMARKAVIMGPIGAYRRLEASDVEAILRLAAR
ncbi:MAG: iron-containing alcohol dehydrogenase [Treponemataceae bacterium]|nr:iron-containing alcohol dehydrogenase [Treponemataceae bacterium]